MAGTPQYFHLPQVNGTDLILMLTGVLLGVLIALPGYYADLQLTQETDPMRNWMHRVEAVGTQLLHLEAQQHR